MGKKDTRNYILNAAMDLFSVRGFSAVTTKEISERAGVSEVTLFRYFPTKRSLFTTIAQECVQPSLLLQFATVDFSWDAQQDLTAIAAIMKKLFQDNRKIIKMNLKDMPALHESDDQLNHFPEMVKSVIKNYFTEYQHRKGGDKDPELLAISFATAMFGLTMNFFVVEAYDTAVSFDDVAAELIRMFALSLEMR